MFLIITYLLSDTSCKNKEIRFMNGMQLRKELLIIIDIPIFESFRYYIVKEFRFLINVLPYLICSEMFIFIILKGSLFLFFSKRFSSTKKSRPKISTALQKYDEIQGNIHIYRHIAYEAVTSNNFEIHNEDSLLSSFYN